MKTFILNTDSGNVTAQLATTGAQATATLKELKDFWLAVCAGSKASTTVTLSERQISFAVEYHGFSGLTQEIWESAEAAMAEGCEFDQLEDAAVVLCEAVQADKLASEAEKRKAAEQAAEQQAKLDAAAEVTVKFENLYQYQPHALVVVRKGSKIFLELHWEGSEKRDNWSLYASYVGNDEGESISTQPAGCQRDIARILKDAGCPNHASVAKAAAELARKACPTISARDAYYGH